MCVCEDTGHTQLMFRYFRKNGQHLEDDLYLFSHKIPVSAGRYTARRTYPAHVPEHGTIKTLSACGNRPRQKRNSRYVPRTVGKRRKMRWWWWWWWSTAAAGPRRQGNDGREPEEFAVPYDPIHGAALSGPCDRSAPAARWRTTVRRGRAAALGLRAAPGLPTPGGQREDQLQLGRTGRAHVRACLLPKFRPNADESIAIT